MTMNLNTLIERHKSGEPIGIASICSAHPVVLDAAISLGRDTRRPVLIESTCNQVNHRGGYTGQTPAEFVAHVSRQAERIGLPGEQLILGGDHLGPGPWQKMPAAEAMAESRALVAAYLQAGYSKIHLDASMSLADDPPGPLDVATIAARAADLAAVAEAHRRAYAPAPVYVIGTEVPVAGGLPGEGHSFAVTRPADAAETIAASRAAFVSLGLDGAWQRVIALVVQPGVEYGDETIIDYDRPAAADLSRFVESQPGLVYEAHSTDYQTPAALRALVEDHFAILKVGPGLTFAYREALFALEAIERAWLGGARGFEPSNLQATLDAAMVANPVYWRSYYEGDDVDLARKRAYSFSDRSRYYWPVAEVGAAVARLLDNLSVGPLPLALLSQYMPRQFARVREGRLPNDAPELAADAVTVVLESYFAATA